MSPAHETRVETTSSDAGTADGNREQEVEEQGQPQVSGPGQDPRGQVRQTGLLAGCLQIVDALRQAVEALAAQVRNGQPTPPLDEKQ